jgi:hypothetical protein
MVDSRRRELDDSLLDRIRAVVAPGDEIYTLTSKRPNRIVSIDRAGIEVETIRSDDRGSGPQLVPAWMIDTAWAHLRRYGRLTHEELLLIALRQKVDACLYLSAQCRDAPVSLLGPCHRRLHRGGLEKAVWCQARTVHR